MKIKNNCILLSLEDDLNSVTEAMKTENISNAVVLAGDEIPVGVLCYEDIVHSPDNIQGAGINEDIKFFMRQDFTVVSEQTNLEDFLEENLDMISFPMVAIDGEGHFKGIITQNEMLKILYKDLQYVKKILDNIDEGIIAIDKDDNIAFINESWKQIHGIENNEIIGESVLDKFPETKFGTEEMSEGFNEPIYMNFSGATVFPSYKSIVDSDNQSMGAMAIVRDSSKINNIYIGINRINMANILFKSMFDYLKEAVVYVDKNYQIIYCNRSFSEIFEVKPQNTMPDSKLKKIIKEKYKEVILNAFSKEIEITIREKIKTFNISGIPILNAVGEPDGIILVLNDITRLKNLDFELQRKGKMLDYYKKEAYRIPNEMICESENFKSVISTALKVASTDAAVLIEGENGVGKELVAKLIHNNSTRKGRAFIPVNCGAIPETLWESEMFGYEDGAFTGAKKGGKLGIFEMANGGTVFLDEIGEMSLTTQVKMLRFLQNMEIEKVGRKEVKKVDVRIIAATNKSIEKMVDEETFRIDLYYRLNVVKLKIPPLRERKAEIRLLTKKFVAGFNDRYSKNVTISDEAVELLEKENWPGNIRQLRNMIEQSVIMCDKEIQSCDLPIDINPLEQIQRTYNADTNEEKCWDVSKRVRELEKELIGDALDVCGNNKTKAMKLLNMSRKTFYKKLKEYYEAENQSN